MFAVLLGVLKTKPSRTAFSWVDSRSTLNLTLKVDELTWTHGLSNLCDLGWDDISYLEREGASRRKYYYQGFCYNPAQHPSKKVVFYKDKYIFLVNIFANEITYLFTPPYKYADHII